MHNYEEKMKEYEEKMRFYEDNIVSRLNQPTEELCPNNCQSEYVL